ncbi:MAG: hypothetical protein COA49_05100 [Bacteroidetes bacterium]|nr:MAG: hypothetical protein COA49_05100 [Bacteroidota bacterium]
MKFIFLLITSVFCISINFSQSSCPNPFDNNLDGTISIYDLMGLLSIFGEEDLDFDGLIDSYDLCIDLNACNFLNIPTELCLYDDALAICGGSCLSDVDGDGICDDVDACIGPVDVCGVCNGTDALASSIESITFLYDSVYATSANQWVLFVVGADTIFNYICPSTFSNCGEDVIFDNYNYSTVQIGNQCWFSENCRYLPSVSPASSGNAVDPFYYVYGYEGADVAEAKSTSNYSTYGTLYNFPAIMLGEMCPTGWHIPTDLEWQVLEVFLGMSPLDASSTGFRGTDQGNQIKSIVGWSNNNGTNTSGFSALPAGYRNPTGVFYSLGNQAYLWSSSVSELSEPWARKLKGGPRILRNVFNQGFGYSTRCISD